MGLYGDLRIQNHAPWHVPGCFAAVQVHPPTNPLLVNLGLKWIFPPTETSLWMHHKRWHFSSAGCFWKNILDECQARPHEMSWWLSKETCQEPGWIKIATAPCGCEESKDHREKSLFVFKIIISKWFWACRMHQTGRQASRSSMSDARGRRQRRAADGGEGDGASDFSPSQMLCKAWKTPFGWQASVSPDGLEYEVGEINSIQLGNAMQIAIYREWKRNTKRTVKIEKWAKRKQLCGHRGKYQHHGQIQVTRAFPGCSAQVFTWL